MLICCFVGLLMAVWPQSPRHGGGEAEGNWIIIIKIIIMIIIIILINFFKCPGLFFPSCYLFLTHLGANSSKVGSPCSCACGWFQSLISLIWTTGPPHMRHSGRPMCPWVRLPPSPGAAWVMPQTSCPRVSESTSRVPAMAYGPLMPMGMLLPMGKPRGHGIV